MPSLPPAPVRYETAEGQNIEVTVVTRGLARPWSLAFVGNDTMLVTERAGKLRVIRAGKLEAEPVAGVPEVRAEGLAGLMDIALHPEFATNGYVYLAYSKPISTQDAAVAVARGRWDGSALRDTTDVFVAGAETTGGARMAFGGDGMLYLSAGGSGDSHPQDPASHGGKVLRLTPAGRVPADNPFVGREGYKPEIYHARSSQHARLGRASRRRAKSGSSKWDRTAATRSTCSRPAATTVGRS